MTLSVKYRLSHLIHYHFCCILQSMHLLTLW
uniref:Uncharacterized protein n=1 Tax=Anguilla anguilla TaxID=7936 RepID=A0A0E9VKG3_ANGAN